MADEPFCTVHNFLTAPVIQVQNDLFRAGIIFFKSQHNLRSGSPKAVNGLIVITDNEQIRPVSRQHPDNLILHTVNILELIHKNIWKSFLPHC